jgi:hypothetical protein
MFAASVFFPFTMVHVFYMVHDRLSDEDRKAQLKLHGGQAVKGKDYAGASKFYTEVYHCVLSIGSGLLFLGLKRWHWCFIQKPCFAYILTSGKSIQILLKKDHIVISINKITMPSLILVVLSRFDFFRQSCWTLPTEHCIQIGASAI